MPSLNDHWEVFPSPFSHCAVLRGLHLDLVGLWCQEVSCWLAPASWLFRSSIAAVCKLPHGVPHGSGRASINGLCLLQGLWKAAGMALLQGSRFVQWRCVCQLYLVLSTRSCERYIYPWSLGCNWHYFFCKEGKETPSWSSNSDCPPLSHILWVSWMLLVIDVI